jgi:thiamine-phosphate pyrophosphorylase
MNALPRPPLLVITDRKAVRGGLEGLVESIFAGGSRWLSLREKDLPAVERTALLHRLSAIGERWNATVGIHGDMTAALPAGAAALHLPRNGSVARAREALGPRVLIGVSAHDLGEAESAAATGADYVTLSPIFVSAGKRSYGPALGLGRLAAIAQAVTIPIVALGGIDAGNAASCLEAGAQGVAVMGAAMRAEKPEAMIRRLVTSIGDALAEGPSSRHSRIRPPNREAPP